LDKYGTLSQLPGVRIIAVPTDGGRPSLSAVLADLGQRRVTHLLVEAGPRLGRSFLSSHTADRVWVFQSPNSLGDANAPNSYPVSYPPIRSLDLDRDTLTEYLNRRSRVFFAPEPSADFVLAAEQNS
jgi:riboflavin biosynthesis pyrimidine reductase